ncbi:MULTISPECIES: GNAT family N-acetyltransferase [Mumia]|uniref:GNAT family N-acetyltransferase n=1 Tax=Mumia TaxID=1546255 RepID=UPI001423562A|nr:GNAT family N-acetyltransferase [Mumia sp. ZJ430]
MTLATDRADFDDPRLAAFLQEHLDDLAPTAPPESQHALDLDGLRRPAVRMWCVEDPEGIVATGALVVVEPAHEELKSMRTHPRARGRGLARDLVGHLLDDARTRGVRRVSLETGSQDFFLPARALYAKAGFEVCGPFGTYVLDPHSTYMTRMV